MMSRHISSQQVSPAPTGGAPEKGPLDGRLVLLEPFDVERHSASLYLESHKDEEAKLVWKFLPDGPFENVASFTQFATRMMMEPARLLFTIRDKSSERLGGMAMYLDIRPPHASIEIGYIWFAPFLQRTPQATEALFLMLRYAFDDLQYRRVQWRCNAMNEKSRRAAERLGFSFEGIFYQHMVVKGHNRDTAWYSMLDHEWPLVRSNFERWLEPSNFDIQGGQILSLRRLNERRA